MFDFIFVQRCDCFTKHVIFGVMYIRGDQSIVRVEPHRVGSSGVGSGKAMFPRAFGNPVPDFCSKYVCLQKFAKVPPESGTSEPLGPDKIKSYAQGHLKKNPK